MADLLTNPAEHAEPYTSSDWSSDLDLSAAFASVGLVPIWIYITDGGLTTSSLVVKTKAVPGSDTTWTVATGQKIDVQVDVIDATTDVTEILVGFGRPVSA